MCFFFFILTLNFEIQVFVNFFSHLFFSPYSTTLSQKQASKDRLDITMALVLNMYLLCRFQATWQILVWGKRSYSSLDFHKSLKKQSCCVRICIFLCICVPELPKPKYCPQSIIESSFCLKLFHLHPYNGIALLVSLSQSIKYPHQKKTFVSKNGPKLPKMRHFFDFICKKQHLC